MADSHEEPRHMDVAKPPNPRDSRDFEWSWRFLLVWLGCAAAFVSVVISMVRERDLVSQIPIASGFLTAAIITYLLWRRAATKELGDMERIERVRLARTRYTSHVVDSSPLLYEEYQRRSRLLHEQLAITKDPAERKKFKKALSKLRSDHYGWRSYLARRF